MISQVVLLIAVFFAWALVHSLTAGSRSKLAFQQRFGVRAFQGLYRLLYNIFSLITFLLVLAALAAVVPERLLYSIPMPYRLLNHAIQGLGLLGLAYSLWQTDALSFAGLRQFGRYLNGEEIVEPASPIVTTGTYGLVRHPLYLFSLLFLWANPVMTVQSVVLYSYVTIYFYIGSRYEEKRLEAAFGDAYSEYKQSVPGFIPFRLPG